MSSSPPTGGAFITTSPGRQVRGGEHRHHGVHTREPPQRHALVRDAILRADDRDFAGRRRKVVQRPGCVLRFDGQHHNIPGAPLDFRRVANRRDPGRGRAVRCPHRQAIALDSLEVRAPGDQEDVVPRLEQTAADAAADRACAVDDVAQLPALVVR